MRDSREHELGVDEVEVEEWVKVKGKSAGSVVFLSTGSPETNVLYQDKIKQINIEVKSPGKDN